MTNKNQSSEGWENELRGMDFIFQDARSVEDVIAFIRTLLTTDRTNFTEEIVRELEGMKFHEPFSNDYEKGVNDGLKSACHLIRSKNKA